MSSIGSFVNKKKKKVEWIKNWNKQLTNSNTHSFLLARAVVKKRNYPDISSGDKITIPITAKFRVSHRRQKHLAVYVVSNEMWKVDWE
jgi:hypothetical protein